MVDVKTLELLAERIDADSRQVHALNPAAMRSVADIIRRAIGAPLMWPSRTAGADAADAYYPGSPDLRHAFNAGVKWAVEHYGPTVEIERR
jgi:hypothetical protein